jgi:hypothetical protein
MVWAAGDFPDIARTIVDVVLSSFGAMFGADHAATAA